MTYAVLEKHGAVGLITLTCPLDYHALDLERMRELNEIIDQAINDREIRAICLTGSGKGFCSGARFGEFFEQGAALQGHLDQLLTPIVAGLHDGPKPTVIAVNGPAAGAGVGLALAGDVTMAARSANFRLSFVRLGAVLDGGTSWLLPRKIGEARARALALTGEPIDARTAEAWGMILRCVEDDCLLSEAMTVAASLAEGPPIAIRAIRNQLNMSLDRSLGEAMAEENRIQANIFDSDDLQEGVSAFLEKRNAIFLGN